MYLNSKSFATKEEALYMFLKLWNPEVEKEIISIRDAQGRITSVNVYSKNTLPICRSSKLDGIAVRFSDFENGMPDISNWLEGVDYVAVDTGDDFSDDFDTVIAIEAIKIDSDGKISINPNISIIKGQNIKGTGEMVKKSELLVKAGTKLCPVHLALLATGGIDMVEVEKKPVVAYIPTGNELVPVGNDPKRGENIESNSLMIEGLLKDWGGEFISYPIIKDKKEDIENTLNDALEKADIVLINGGSSKGSEDYVSKILDRRASFFQHGIRSIPGIPVSIGIVEGKPVINLPGPTLAAFYAMDWCVQKLVHHQLNIKTPIRQKVKAVLQSDVKKPVQYDYYLRLHLIKNGETYEANVLALGDRLSESISNCNGIAVVPIGISGYKKGQIIEAELLYGESVVPIRQNRKIKKGYKIRKKNPLVF